jgi:hypothetical protein
MEDIAEEALRDDVRRPRSPGAPDLELGPNPVPPPHRSPVGVNLPLMPHVNATRRRPVGYYVHHHGAGHAAHATAVARQLGGQLTGLGSGPIPEGWPGPWVALPRDDDPIPGGDPTHEGAWHWVPDDHVGFTDRMRSVAAWIGETDPAVLVSDVSVEVSVLAHLLGVPSVPVLLHGCRTDRPHRLALDTAAAIIAPWPTSHIRPWHQRWASKIHPVGFMSRHDGRPSGPASVSDKRVLLVLPSGGHSIDADAVESAARASASCGWAWDVAGAATRPQRAVAHWHGSVDDLWPFLERASVVIAAAGAATVADIAAARRPAVLLPQPRPFDEQLAFAALLQDAAPVRVRPRWPAPTAWPALLDEVGGLGGETWGRLHDGLAASRFAEVLCRFR